MLPAAGSAAFSRRSPVRSVTRSVQPFSAKPFSASAFAAAFCSTQKSVSDGSRASRSVPSSPVPLPRSHTRSPRFGAANQPSAKLSVVGAKSSVSK